MLNKVQLIGFTGSEPEIRQAGQTRVAVLRIATSRYTKKDGERRDYTTWHTVEVWNQGAVTWLANRGLATGTKVFVEGEIRNERFTDEAGQDRFFSKVVVATAGHELKSLDRPSDNDADAED